MNIVSISTEAAIIDLSINGLTYRLNIGGFDSGVDIESYLRAHEAEYVEKALKCLTEGISLPLAPSLETIKANAVKTIDEKAEDLCSAWITVGDTQSIRYTRKLAQAEAYLKDSDPNETKYPLIFAEVGVTASTANAVATTICQRAAACYSYFDKVEAVRMKAHGSISLAASATEVSTTLQGIVWPNF